MTLYIDHSIEYIYRCENRRQHHMMYHMLIARPYYFFSFIFGRNINMKKLLFLVHS